MSEAHESVEEERDRFDADLLAVRQVNPLERRMPFDQCVDTFIGEVDHLKTVSPFEVEGTQTNLY